MTFIVCIEPVELFVFFIWFVEIVDTIEFLELVDSIELVEWVGLIDSIVVKLGLIGVDWRRLKELNSLS